MKCTRCRRTIYGEPRYVAGYGHVCDQCKKTKWPDAEPKKDEKAKPAVTTQYWGNPVPGVR